MSRKFILPFSLLIGCGVLLFILDKNYEIGSRVVGEKDESKKPAPTMVKKEIPPEISAILKTEKLDERVKFYTKLIERLGPVQAQEELFLSGLPFDGQTHLLNHIVGEYLYEKEGKDGLSFCKEYFLSSCYHGFVIEAVGDGGVVALKEVMGLCWKKGGHIAIQCAHAIGHGFLAWVGYPRLTKALEECDSLSKISDNFPLYNCHDGVFMENIWAVHEGGRASEYRWVSGDPVYPCNDNRIDPRYIQACWSNQPMRMYQMFRGDVGRVGYECLQITNSSWQSTCFDGLARQIHPESKGSVEEVFRMCGLMPDGWVDPCIISIAKAAFSVGDKSSPYILCERLGEASRGRCWETLSSIIVSYTRNNPSEREALCKRITDKKIADSCRV